jgi:hypothetical protein
VLALALATLAAAASPVEVDRDGSRLVALHDGRRTVLARGVIGGYSVSGRRVAYVELRERTALLHVVRVGRRLARLETLRLFRTRDRTPPLDAVLTSRGALAWLTPRGVMLRRPGRRPRRLTRTPYTGIELEDDATLRLGPHLRYIDLRPFPGCGGRSRFGTVLETAELVVTEARYDTTEKSWTVLRACRREDGRDPVIEVNFDLFPDGSAIGVAGADRDWVVTTRDRGSRYGDAHVLVRSAQAITARRGPGATLSLYHGDPAPEFWPPNGGELAVSDAGVPAWVRLDDDLHRLVAIPRRGRYRLLDSGPPGSIADLAFDGMTLHWTHDGGARSAIP